jgi:Holliday junction DNA helicase RuvA
VIHHVEGLLAEKHPGRVVVETGGVGLELLVTADTVNELGPPGISVRLLTHLVVREDAWTLFGFASEEERALFRLLLGVQGVGPRVALAILSGLAPAKLRLAVGDGDVAALTAVPGVGKKTAQRMIVDLRDKVGKVGRADDAVPGAEGATEEGGTAAPDDAVDALVALGYSRAQAREAVRVARGEGAEVPVEDVVRDALRRL